MKSKKQMKADAEYEYYERDSRAHRWCVISHNMRKVCAMMKNTAGTTVNVRDAGMVIMQCATWSVTESTRQSMREDAPGAERKGAS